MFSKLSSFYNAHFDKRNLAELRSFGLIFFFIIVFISVFVIQQNKDIRKRAVEPYPCSYDETIILAQNCGSRGFSATTCACNAEVVVVNPTSIAFPTPTPMGICGADGGVQSQACVDFRHIRYYCRDNNIQRDENCPFDGTCRNGVCTSVEVTSTPTPQPQLQTNTEGEARICGAQGGIQSQSCVDSRNMRYFCRENNAQFDELCPQNGRCRNGVCTSIVASPTLTVTSGPISIGGGAPTEIVVGVLSGACYCQNPQTNLNYICNNQTVCCSNQGYLNSTIGKQVCAVGEYEPNGYIVQTDINLHEAYPLLASSGCGPSTVYNICINAGITDCDLNQIITLSNLSEDGTYINELINTLNTIGLNAEYTFASETDDGVIYGTTINQPINNLSDEYMNVMEQTTQAGNVIMALVEVTDDQGTVIQHYLMIDHCENDVCTGVDSYFNLDGSVNYSGVATEFNLNEMPNVQVMQLVTVETSDESAAAESL